MTPEIITKTTLPSNTYFRTSEIAPTVVGNTMTIFNARGQSRSWGCPSVKSSVRQLADDVVAVEVTGWHKWTISPVGGTFYFVHTDAGWVRRTANFKRIKALLA